MSVNRERRRDPRLYVGVELLSMNDLSWGEEEVVGWTFQKMDPPLTRGDHIEVIKGDGRRPYFILN